MTKLTSKTLSGFAWGYSASNGAWTETQGFWSHMSCFLHLGICCLGFLSTFPGFSGWCFSPPLPSLHANPFEEHSITSNNDLNWSCSPCLLSSPGNESFQPTGCLMLITQRDANSVCSLWIDWALSRIQSLELGQPRCDPSFTSNQWCGLCILLNFIHWINMFTESAGVHVLRQRNEQNKAIAWNFKLK